MEIPWHIKQDAMIEWMKGRDFNCEEAMQLATKIAESMLSHGCTLCRKIPESGVYRGAKFDENDVSLCSNCLSRFRVDNGRVVLI